MSKSPQGLRMSLPINPPSPVPLDPFVDILRAVGIVNPLALEYSPTTKKLLVRIPDDADIKAISPDFASLRAASNPSTHPVKGVIVTRKGTKGLDFISRYFAPWVGINEDPVTGSAHTVLAPYWGGVLKLDAMTARQESRQGGTLGVAIEGKAVVLTGAATTVMEGTLLV